ncbi:MAG TPA: oxidoreductase-like domain-containing protein [Rhodanobacteraceae bacterium]|nr:oxidoreductase-like domain-containing protein [Rhodanobacteraceae bacterium]
MAWALAEQSRKRSGRGTQAGNADPDPRPQPPEKPLSGDCCDSGCDNCVLDTYAREMDVHRERLAAWQQRHPDAEGDAHP